MQARLLAGITLLVLASPARAQRQPPRPSPNDSVPDWVYADSNLVDHPSWISGTVVKNIVVLAFKPGTTSERQAAIVRMVHGTFVRNDSALGGDGFVMIRVASHPNACAVKQAIELLEHVAEVEMATPELLVPLVEGVPAAHDKPKGSAAPCPPGIGLLR